MAAATRVRVPPKIPIEIENCLGELIKTHPINPPLSVFPDDENSSVGNYLRELIIYLFNCARTMGDAWNKRRIKHVHLHGGVNRAAINNYWLNGNALLLREKKNLVAVCDEIKWACLYLFGLHRYRDAPKAFQNLQRRNEYLLYLCILALSDSRLLAYESKYYQMPGSKDDEVNVPKEFNNLLGYNSGLGVGTCPGQYVATLYICDEFCLDPQGRNRRFRVKLPRHFIQLIQKLYGNSTLNQMAFSSLLGRYALFLSLLIWNPSFYDCFSVVWNDPYRIFGMLDKDAHRFFKEQVPIEGYVLHWSYQKYSDRAALCDTLNNGPTDWTNDQPGVSPLDESGTPVPHNLWDQFYKQDFIQDTAGNGGLWLRMMIS